MRHLKITWHATCSRLYYTHINRMRKEFKILCFNGFKGLDDEKTVEESIL